MIPYLFHTSLLLAACFIFYWLFLKQETFFKLNRWVLVASLILSIVIPLLQIPASWSLPYQIAANRWSATPSIIKPKTQKPSVFYSVELEDTTMANTDLALEQQDAPATAKTSLTTLTLLTVLRYIYFIGIGVFLVGFLVQLVLLIAKMNVLESFHDGKYKIVELNKDEAPYSFWNAIFINPNKYDLATYQQIIAHEKIHIQQFHFFDKLLAELILIVFWFNPFVWLFRTAITNNLEFLTDDSMLQQGVERQSYQLSLLKVSVPQHPLNLSINYNQSFLKNRIAMMNSKKSSAQSIWKYLFILPLLGLSIVSLNAVRPTPKALDTKEALNKVEKTNVPPTTETTKSITDEEQQTTKATKSSAVPPNAAQVTLDNTLGSPLEKLKKEITTTLLRDKLIRSKQDPAQLQFHTNEVLFTGNALPKSLAQKYKALVDRYQLKACPCDHLFLTDAYIRVGNMTDQGFEGTIHGDYDVDQEENLNYYDGSKKMQGQHHHEDNGVVHSTSSSGSHYHADNGVVHTNTGSYHSDNGVVHTTNSTGQARHEDRGVLYANESIDYDNPMNSELELLGKLDAMRLQEPPNAHWSLPLLQEKLLKYLKDDGLISSTQKVQFEISREQIRVNEKLASTKFQARYLALFKSYQIEPIEEWAFYKNGANILVLDEPIKLEEFQEKLLWYGLQQKLISSTKESFTLEIPGHQLVFNGKKLSQSQFVAIHELFAKYSIIPAPGKKIIFNPAKASLQIGYALGKGIHMGTWYSSK